MNLSRKSQLFVFDLILSVVILVVSFGIFLSYYVSTTENVDIYELNYQILNAFTKTKINSLNNEEIRELFLENRVRNIENTVAQQIAEFYYHGDLGNASSLSNVFLQSYLTNQLNANITLHNGSSTYVLYSQQPTTSYEEAVTTSVTQRTVRGFLNRTSSYGPYTIKVVLWQ